MDKLTREQIKRIGREQSLSGRTLNDFVSFMKKRLPYEGDINYTTEWATRFKKGIEWHYGDSKSRRVLLSLNKEKYKGLLEDFPISPKSKKLKMKKPAFGSVAWQNKQAAKFKNKLRKGQKLSGADRAFAITQLMHNYNINERHATKLFNVAYALAMPWPKKPKKVH